MCARGEEQRQKLRREEESRRSTTVAFQAYGRPLVEVSEFKYLGRLLTYSDGYWPAVVGNMRKARKRWAQMSRILGREGSGPGLPGFFTRR